MSTEPVVLHDLLDAANARHPGVEAVADPRRAWDYRELTERTHAAAAWLGSMGVGRGDRVVVHQPNRLESAALLFACSRLGAVFVPVDRAATPFQLRHIVPDAEPALVLTNADVDTTAPVLDLDRVWPAVLERLGVRVTADVRPDEPVTLIYTSGSTSAPKGVVCPHDSVLFAVSAVASRLRYTAADRVFLALPLAFDYGLYQLLLAVHAGASLRFAPPGKAAGLLAALDEARGTVLPVVPPLAALLNQLAARKPGGRDVRLITNTGAALNPGTVERLRANFPGAGVVFMFGLTECKRVSISEPDADLLRPGSVGQPLPGTRVVVVDDVGNPVPVGVTGEIVVSGPHVMNGYFRAPELTALRFRADETGRQRALRTGDYGRLDEDGHLYFEARRDDVFKRRGTRMSSGEIEAAAQDIAGVEAAVALPAAEGERLTLAVTGAVDPATVLAGLTDRLDQARRPDECVVLGDLPLGTTGKVDRAAVAALISTRKAGQ